MSKKYKVLKVSREVGNATKVIGPSMISREANEFAKNTAQNYWRLRKAIKPDWPQPFKEADILLSGSVQITREMMEAATKCIAVLFQTVGYDQIDLKAKIAKQYTCSE